MDPPFKIKTLKCQSQFNVNVCVFFNTTIKQINPVSAYPIVCAYTKFIIVSFNQNISNNMANTIMICITLSNTEIKLSNLNKCSACKFERKNTFKLNKKQLIHKMIKRLAS